MVLTPEQFNKLALKDDLKNFPTKEDINKKFDEIQSSINGLAKLVKNNLEENIANQGAHDRIQNDINQVRGHVGMKIKNPVLGVGKL